MCHIGFMAEFPPPAHLCTGEVKTEKLGSIGKKINSGCVPAFTPRSEEHTSELQSQSNLVCRLLLEKKKNFAVRKESTTLTATSYSARPSGTPSYATKQPSICSRLVCRASARFPLVPWSCSDTMMLR